MLLQYRHTLFNSKNIFRSIALILTAYSAFITIYHFHFQKKRIQFVYEIILNTQIFDIKASVSELKVFYYDLNLLEKHSNLRIIKIRVKNVGTETILKEHYDNVDPLGFEIKNCIMIEKPAMVDASNRYLKQNLYLEIDSIGKVIFSPIIMEPNEYFIIKILVLYNVHKEPEIIPRGKIAGTTNIDLINTVSEKVKVPFFQQVFSGTTLVHLVRLLLYGLVGFLVICIIFVISFYTSDKLFKRGIDRNKVVKQSIDKFYTYLGYTPNEEEEKIIRRYYEEGSLTLELMYILCEDAKLLNSQRTNPFYSLTIEKMIADGIVYIALGKLVIKEPMKALLQKLIEFLERKRNR